MLLTLIILALLYTLSTMGRTGHKSLPAFRPWLYAHRGLHNESLPENSLAAFRNALEHGFGVELDLHLTADGNLAVIHDSALKRTTGLPGRVEDLTTADLSRCFLGGTGETIPTFRQVLELFAGKAPLIIELKTAGDNYAALCAEACRQLADYDGLWCMESFDPRCVYWLKKHRPDIVRGQLTENFVKNGAPVPFPLRFAITHQMINFLTRPDFVAYKFSDRKTLSNFLARKLWGLQGVAWTVRTPAELAAAQSESWIPIFENFLP